MKTSPDSRARARGPRLNALAAAVLALAGGSAQAFEIDSGNPDLKLRLDTTVRYNLGVRAEDCDKNICGNGAGLGDVTAHQSDRKFAKAGKVMANRIDLLPEFDAVYQGRFGLRVSGAAWYDAAYKNRVEGDPALSAAAGGAFQGAGPNGGPYSDYTKRFNIGPSAEFLDAFVFAKFKLGEIPVAVKAGQHNIYWGESLFSFVNGISVGQGPVDFRKAIATPGIEAKEVFRPLKQLSFSADLTDRMSLAGQYFLDWKPTILPDGGTYFGAADGLSMAGGGSIFGVPFGGVTAEPKHKRGDFGLALKMRPEWLDGSMGLYYREYTDKTPQLVITGLAVVGGNVAPTGFGLDYSTPRQKLFGLSLSKQMFDISFGADLTYRKDAQIAARPFATPAGTADLGGGPIGNSLLPTGDVFSGVVNAIAYFGKTAVFDSAALQAEINFSHLISVKSNPGSFYADGYNCPQALTEGFPYGCATKNSMGIAIAFEPKWFQVMNGVDLSMPLFLGVGVKGNSVVAFGDNKGQGSYAIGATADVDSKYTVTLKYNGFLAKHGKDELGAASNSNASLGKYWDRGFVSLTLKTTF
ncbi:DUF1302 domain-containing protein [Piscinibacter sp.]|uniref:DUF1302 domain-containing protein n=1 Tax=Piscinibacter sp. TaxID=1903157 RepID=UPI0039E376B6